MNQNYLNLFIGFDLTNRIPGYVLLDSILEKSSIPIRVTYLNKNNLQGFFNRPRGEFDSTDFSISRFLVPYLSNYQGWSLFIDNDMVVRTDIAELTNYMVEDYSVRCVKHNQIVKNDTKFRGERQTKYNMKNWTSVILFNNEKCGALTPEYVENTSGLDLHQFKWLKNIDTEIGDIPLSWNYLADVESMGQEQVNNPKLIHYTEGGPFFKATKDCEYAKDWLDAYNRMNDYLKY